MIKPRRVDHVTRVSLALFTRLFDWRDAVVSVRPSTIVRWHRLVGNQFQTLLVNPDGVICSIVFPGLWLDPTALLAGNMPRVLEVLQRGLESHDHAEFVAQLRK